MIPTYEIEIKSLIGDARHAVDLVAKMKETDTKFIARGSHKQLNHYFIKGNLELLKQNIKSHFPKNKQNEFDDLLSHTKDFSVRTRLADTIVLFVIKATVDDTTSSNGTARQEFESEVDISLEDLDRLLIDSEFEYQAKWSRERQEFLYKGLNVTVDRNAGYGYLAEFESLIDDKSKAEETKKKIRKIMDELGIAELPQDRLQRMFDFYNKNWRDYYGTDDTFLIE